MLLKVGNIKKDTVALWQKGGQDIKSDQQLSFTEGVLKLEIAQVRNPRDTGYHAPDFNGSNCTNIL